MYKILSLDGGGTWCLNQIRALIDLYSPTTTGHEVLKDFDLVAANSAGSVVLGGLIENMQLSAMLDMIDDEHSRHSIFPPTRKLADAALQATIGIGPQYSTDAKLPALERLFPKNGNTPFNMLPKISHYAGGQTEFLVIAYDYDRESARFFRSYMNLSAYGDGTDACETLAEVIHASTNAPINYFDGPATHPESTERYWDGGITGNNNPALVALTDAVSMGACPKSVRILSLGTGTVQLPAGPLAPYGRQRSSPSLKGDIEKMALCILDDPPDFATYVCHVMMGGAIDNEPSRIVRLNPIISPIKPDVWVAPDGWTAAQFQYMTNIGMDALSQNDVNYITDWCILWMQDKVFNQPIRMNGDTLQSEVGYNTYSQAKASWKAISR